MWDLILNMFFSKLEIYTNIQINHSISLWEDMKANYAHHILCDHTLNLLDGWQRKSAIWSHGIISCMWKVNKLKRIRLKSLVSWASHYTMLTCPMVDKTMERKALRRKTGCISCLKVSEMMQVMKFSHPEKGLLTYLTS